MQFEYYIPKGILKNFIDSIIWMHGGGTGIAFQRMYQVIIINIGNNFHVSPVHTDVPANEHSDTIWINGKHETSLMIENKGITEMYVIGIKHGMLPYLANVPAIETNELAVGAEHWTHKEIFNLREQLMECKSVLEGFVLIEKYFTGLLLKKDLTTVDKIQWLQKAMNSCTVHDICNSLGVTRKKLRSETQHYFGDAVKNIQGIIRFNKTLSGIAHNAHKTLSELHDYYDQAHFINDFKARAGITPLQYKKLCRLYPQIKYTPNFIPLQKETFLQFIAAHYL